MTNIKPMTIFGFSIDLLDRYAFDFQFVNYIVGFVKGKPEKNILVIQIACFIFSFSNRKVPY